MELLNQKHSAFYASAAKLRYALQTVVDVALEGACWLRTQFDRGHLEQTIGTIEIQRLMPHLELSRTRSTNGPFEIHEEIIDSSSRSVLRRLFVRVAIHVESISVLDDRRRLVLRANDMGENVLLSLPEPGRRSVLAACRAQDIPADVFELIEIDESRLYP